MNLSSLYRHYLKSLIQYAFMTIMMIVTMIRHAHMHMRAHLARARDLYERTHACEGGENIVIIVISSQNPFVMLILGCDDAVTIL